MNTNSSTRRAGLRAVCLLAVASACSSGPPKAPNPTTPLNELRARELIAQALREERAQPTSGRKATLRNGKELTVDISVRGRSYGVAFLTQRERQVLGNSIPAYDVGSNALQLVRDFKEPATRVLLLHDLSYLADEQAGAEREVTSIVAERKLQRDVRDFLVRARVEGWP